VTSLAILAVVVAAWLVRYAPRERPAVPAESRLLRSLEAPPAASWSVWMPYPHQNVALWKPAVGDVADWISTGATALRGRPTRIPRAGPWVFPPSSEMVVVYTPATGAAMVKVAVYPEIRWLLRAAGWLASNPWLRGGEVRDGVVSWEEGVWVARWRFAGGAATSEADAFAGLVPATAAPPMVITWPARPGLAAIAGPGAADAAAATAGSLCARVPGGLQCGEGWTLPSTAGGLLGVSGRGGWLLVVGEGVRGLPLAVIRPLGSGPKLPLESLFGAGDALSRAEASGWEVVTAGSGAEERSARWLHELAPWDRTADDRMAWIRPEALQAISEARRGLSKLPLVPPAELERWALLEDFLRPFAEQGLAVGWVADGRHRPFSLVVTPEDSGRAPN
jgi:hypothetical protein